MEVVKKEVNVFIVGGKEFLNKDEAEQFNSKLREKLSYRYYRVTYSPDLTEGRGYYDSMVIAVKGGYVANSVTQYLIDNVGSPIAMIQGSLATDNWYVHEGSRFNELSQLEKFLSTRVSVGIGDYRKKKVPDVTYIDSAGKVISLE